MSFFKRKLVSNEFLPLTGDEAAHLLLIYRTRRRFLIVVAFAIVGFDMQLTILNIRPSDDPNFDFFRDAWPFWVAFFFLLAVDLVISLLLYFTQISCYKRDALSGQKCVVHKKVNGKSHFPITDQYFLCLEDGRYLHHEVDESIYRSVGEGDFFPIHFGQYSGYAFNKSGSFTLM